MANRFSRITPEILELSSLFEGNSRIDPSYYDKYDVKRGLRDINGKGVLTGLTVISEIVSSKIVDGKEYSCEGTITEGSTGKSSRVSKEDRLVMKRQPIPVVRRLPDSKRCAINSYWPTIVRCLRILVRYHYEGSQPRHDEHAGQAF